MDLSVLNTYIPTLIRYVLVAGGLAAAMFIVYQVQLRLGARSEAAAGRTLVMPWVVGFLIFNVFTIGASLYLSFTEYNLFRPPEWVGTENYAELFDLAFAPLESADQRSSSALPPRYDEIVRVQIADGGFVLGAREESFWRSMRLTVVYAIVTVPLGLAGALAVALLLNQNVRGMGIWRVLYYLPAVLPAVATALLWRWMFSSSGLVNSALSPFLNLLNLETPQWLTNPSLSPVLFIIISLWGVFGANSVILLAGLKGIPKELYEAVDIDGGGHWPKFRNVTIPMLSPALFYNLVTSLIGALQAFEVAAFIPTPIEAGTFLNWQIYQEAFNLRNMGMASAMAWIMLMLIIALTALVFRSSQAWVFYQGAREGA
ncbi:sugar ABC transporter permease [Candidatus Flexifilum breve]|uniref:carbohydrate ABC transporter permease n=1 Tax=Candidatus Flexifilum breve TaxID=3140694 RepID=UPI0031CC5E85